MQLKAIVPIGAGKYLHRYDLLYTMNNGAEKRYEVVARCPITTAADIPGAAADGVVMIVLSEDKTKLLLNREFRPAVNDYVYNFPAGLAEKGETPQQTAARELHEETGLEIKQQIALLGKSYGAVGLSNESAQVLICTADAAAPLGGRQDPAEEITPLWITKQQAAQLAQCERITARVQLFLALWAGGIL